MDRTGLVVTLFVLGYLGFEVYGVHSSRHLMEPGYILARYTAAQRAVQRCGATGTPDRAQFEHNLAVMRRKAAAALAEASPAVDGAAAQARVDQRAAQRAAEVDALIDAEGCDSKAVWTLAKTYQQSARLRLR